MNFTVRTYKRAVQAAQAEVCAHFADCKKGMSCPDLTELIRHRNRIIRRKRRERKA